MKNPHQEFTYDVTTMGCKVNTYDTSHLQIKLNNAGFKHTKISPQVKIINSCAVTENSTLDTHKMIQKLKRKSPDTQIVVTGCVAQVDVERLKEQTGADLIIANSHKTHFEEILRQHLEGKNRQRVFHSNIFRKEELDEGGGIEASHTRAFLKIQDGCNSFCSFCIIPFARGKSRSSKVEDLVGRVNRLHQEGFQEVVLTGVHCGDYEDEELKFSDLVEKILDKTQIPRIRLSSLEPIEVNEKLWSLFKNPRLCPHIHVSLQSANSKVLKDMKRKYSQDQIKHFFDSATQNIPHGFIGMDVIVGFPGETDEEFLDTFEFLKKQFWAKIHVFPYSVRPGTAAAKRDDHLEESVILNRAQLLRQLSHERHINQAKLQKGLIKSVLVLENPSHGAQGLSRDYWPVEVQGLDCTKYANREIQVEITGFKLHKNGDPALIGQFQNAPKFDIDLRH